MSDGIEIVDNAAWAGAAARVSVLIPFFRDDPSQLLFALDKSANSSVEIVTLDDGSGDDALAATVAATIRATERRLRASSVYRPMRAAPRVATGWPPKPAAATCSSSILTCCPTRPTSSDAG